MGPRAGCGPLSRMIDARAARNGLHPLDIDALQYVAHARPEDCTIGGFARERGLSMGAASTTMSRLLQNGCLRWHGPNGAEGTLDLSEPGEHALELDPLTALAHALEDLPADQRESFRDGLDRVYRHYLSRR